MGFEAWLGCAGPAEPAFEVSFGTTAPGDAAPPATSPGPTVDPPLVEPIRPWYGDWRAPVRIAVDPVSGELVVSDPLGGRIVVRGPDGTTRAVVEVGGAPLAVGVDPEQRVWVGDADTGELRVYDRRWSVVARATGVARPADLAVEPRTGDVFVSDPTSDQVWRFDPTGRALGGFGVADPVGVAVAGDRVWVVSSSERRVHAFDLDGAPITSFGVHGEELGELYLPQGLAIDAAGRVWVVDARVGRVTAFDGAGRYLGHVGEIGVGRGQLRIPSDAVVDGAGRLVVTSTDAARLELFGVDAYQDLQTSVDADIALVPERLVPERVPSPVRAVIEVPGEPLDALADPTANGVPGALGPVGDADGDTVADRVATFDGAALRATLPTDGVGWVRVAATIDGRSLSARVVLPVDGPRAAAAASPPVSVPSGPRASVGTRSGPRPPTVTSREAAPGREPGSSGWLAPATGTTGETAGTGETGRADPSGCASAPGGAWWLALALTWRRRSS